MREDYTPIFQIDSEEYGTINWKYKDQKKQWYQTWQPKAKDIIIINNNLTSENRSAIVAELMVDIERDNRITKDRNNKLAKERRARK